MLLDVQLFHQSGSFCSVAHFAPRLSYNAATSTHASVAHFAPWLSYKTATSTHASVAHFAPRLSYKTATPTHASIAHFAPRLTYKVATSTHGSVVRIPSLSQVAQVVIFIRLKVFFLKTRYPGQVRLYQYAFIYC